MQSNYQAQWASRRRVDELSRAGKLGQAMVLEHFNGVIMVEPVGSDLGDGPVLSPQEADYELQPAWHLGTNATLRQARGLLGLEWKPRRHTGRPWPSERSWLRTSRLSSSTARGWP